MCISANLMLPLSLEAPIMMPNGVTFLLFSTSARTELSMIQQVYQDVFMVPCIASSW